MHSTFFGPIKYAILPQHLNEDEVLGGTGLVEAATYIAILLGTVLAGFMKVEHAVIGDAGRRRRSAGSPRARCRPRRARGRSSRSTTTPFTSSWRLIAATMHIPRLFLAICAISFFWTIGIVLIVIFPPLVKNVLTADKHVASLLTALFSVGIAIGSVAINALLKGHTSAKYGPASVLIMGGFVVPVLVAVRRPGRPPRRGISTRRASSSRVPLALAGDRVADRRSRSSAGCSSCRSTPS